MTEISNINLQNDDLLKRNPELANMLGPTSSAGKKRSKHLNVIVKDPGGEVYDSGKEAADAANLALAVRSGEYLAYIHHLVVKLPSGNKLELDHVLINNMLQVEVFDSKAFDEKTQKYLSTPEWKAKAKEFKAKFGFEIKRI